MKFTDLFRVQSVRVLPPREGKKAQLQVTIATFGATFTVYVSEDYKPLLQVGADVPFEFSLRSGQYGKPEVFVSNVG